MAGLLDDLKKTPWFGDAFKRGDIEVIDMSEMVKTIRVGDVFPVIPEGYEMVKRSDYRSVPLPKPVHLPEALELAHYANHMRQKLFGAPYVPVFESSLPHIRLLTERDMGRWVGRDALGEYSNRGRNLVVLTDEAIKGLYSPDYDVFASDDRSLIARSVLLHELVHWLQYEQTFGDDKPWTKDFDSLMTMEREAWNIQAHWLNEHGQHTSQFARLNDIEATLDRLYAPGLRSWLAARDAREEGR